MVSRLWDWLLGRLGLGTSAARVAEVAADGKHALGTAAARGDAAGADPRGTHDNVFRAFDEVLALRRRGAAIGEVTAALEALINATRICHAAHEGQLGNPTDPDSLRHLQEHRLIVETLQALRDSVERTDATTVSERLRYLHFLLVSHDLR